MALVPEIERTFLLIGEEWRGQVRRSTHIVQGYVAVTDAMEVRVRKKGPSTVMTAKIGHGLRRLELEVAIDAAMADAMLDGCSAVVSKERHEVEDGGHVWEIDEFVGANEGLRLAEIELRSEDEAFSRPAWIGEEVTADPRYSNAYLALHPYRTWPGGPAPHVYLASPLGFTAAGALYNERVLVPALNRAGWAVLDPWNQETDSIGEALRAPDEERLELMAAANAAIGERNVQMLRRADAVLAILDGCDVDSGTAAEIGYFAGLGRAVVGLRTDIRQAGDDEAAVVNIQVEHFVHMSGGEIVSDLESALEKLAERIFRPLGSASDGGLGASRGQI